MKPQTSILDRAFRYTNAANTDIRKTWARHRRQVAEQLRRELAERENVAPIRKAGGR